MTNRSLRIVWRRRSLILTIIAVAALPLLAAGCGGSSSPGVANVSSSTSTSSSSSGGPPTQSQTQQRQHDVVRFARCMHSHGAPVPDPTVAPHAFKNALNTRSPAFQSAYTTCGHLLPGRPPSQSTARPRAQIVALLAFARCLRSHGFPSFPDPTSSGEISREMLASAGIDLHETAVVQAADVCTSVTHGVITRAVVAHFVAGH
jgi:hypothetical protein